MGGKLVGYRRFTILILLIGITLGLRLYQFGEIPHGVNRDEAAIGYTAKLLLTTGKEEHGHNWPLKFESFGDWKRPLYIYLTIPFVWLLGVNTQTVRTLSLIAGMGMIGGAFFLTQKVSHKKLGGVWPGLMTVLFLMANPWHFHFSRLALEPMLAASFMCLGILALLAKGVRGQLVGVGLLTLSLFTYHAALIVIPIWFAGYLWFFKEKLRNKWFVMASLIFGLIWGTLMLSAWLSPERDKVTGTTIFTLTQEEQWQKIYQYRNTTWLSMITQNRICYFARTFGDNYLSTWSPEFLWLKGGIHPHFNVPGFGNFFWVEVVLAAMGVVWVLLRKQKMGYLIVLAILVAPIPAALTKDGIHSTRSVLMLPYLQVLAALGTLAVVDIFRRKWQKMLVLSLILGVLFYSASRFLGYYFGYYRAISDQRFDGYMREVSMYLSEQTDIPTLITYPYESPYMFYAFYTDMDPQVFLDSIDYYPVDKQGFRHARSLLNQQYLPSTKDLETIDPNQLNKALILSRIGEKSPGDLIMTFNDLTGKSHIIATQTKGI